MNSQNSISKIISALQKEKICYEKIHSLLKEQEQAIKKEDESRLLEIIKEKEALIESVRQLDQTIAQTLDDLPGEEMGVLAKKADGVKKDVEELLEKIIRLENACEEKLSEKKLDILSKAKNIKQGKTLLKGYETTRRIKPKISKNV